MVALVSFLSHLANSTPPCPPRIGRLEPFMLAGVYRAAHCVMLAPLI